MRRVRTVLLAAIVMLPLAGAQASAEVPPQQPVFVDGEAQPVYDAADVVREKVFARVPVDSDRDDEVRAEVIRQRATDRGLKVPVLFRPSPYFGGGNRLPKHNVDVELSGVPRGDTALGGPREIPQHIDEKYFLERGYALVYADSIGTGESTGCPITGAATRPSVCVLWWIGSMAALQLGTPRTSLPLLHGVLARPR